MKTNKSYTKRIKVTKKGKLISRKPGLNHFNAKESSKSKMKKKRGKNVIMGEKAKSRFLS